MALSLPYPDLDFVPLDVLTAEEMNQIVANYNYIANQFPITMSNLATAVQTAIRNGGGFNTGDVWAPGSPIYASGIITSDVKHIFISIPLGKSTNNISSISVSALYGTIRAMSRHSSQMYTWGHYVGASDGATTSYWNSYIISQRVTNGVATVELNNNSGWRCSDSNYDLINNSPVVMEVSAATRITFS